MSINHHLLANMAWTSTFICSLAWLWSWCPWVGGVNGSLTSPGEPRAELSAAWSDSTVSELSTWCWLSFDCNSIFSADRPSYSRSQYSPVVCNKFTCKQYNNTIHVQQLYLVLLELFAHYIVQQLLLQGFLTCNTDWCSYCCCTCGYISCTV